MSNPPTNRKSWMLPAPKAPLAAATEFLRRGDVWARIGLCALTATILWIVMFGWAPPFAYRVRQAPVRDMHAHTTFKYKDYKTTQENRDRIRRNFLCYYANDKQPLEQLRRALINDIFEIKQKSFEEIEKSEVWNKFFSAPEEESTEVVATQAKFDQFREALIKDEKLETLTSAVVKAFLDIDKNGLLQNLEHDDIGSTQEIEVYSRLGDHEIRHRAFVSDVRIAEVSVDLRQRLIDELNNESEVIVEGDMVAERIFQWLKPRLPVTLKFDALNTNRSVEAAVKEVAMKMKEYKPGEQLEQIGQDLELQGIKAGIPLDVNDIDLLRAEHEALVASEGIGIKFVRSILFFGLFAAVFSMVCQYLYYRDRHLLDDLKHFAILLGLILFTLTIAWILALNVEWRAEIIPIMIFSMTVSIAYHIELAIILSALVSLAFSVAHGYGMAEFVILTAASSSSALMCRRIRSRTKLVNVGLLVAAIVFPTVIGVSYLLGQPLAMPLLTDAVWFAGGAAISGLIMTALLPFLERWFDIQTDISLLELSDANHALLKELVQRAPGTYNHSINVASISEAAAEAIGANGLLCRVGAYFHDVGKLRKPEYFIENQAGGVNKHDDLVPTMSTLVIIAHVKDGAEIARKHRLPQRIIDLIEQHHGTTLVEFFFKRAEQRLAERDPDDENGSDIDEADYRYPGPRPQTVEAAVLMLADTVESASRALREPAPSRIESLVHEIAKKKLEDGQFDECPITIEQLKIVQNSLIKSLNAMYHARVKYPEQQQSA
jgi:putative nucleotidyltransferase with HDIG domain